MGNICGKWKGECKTCPQEKECRERLYDMMLREEA